MGFWEAARFPLATAAGCVWVFFTSVNLLMVWLRFARHQRASSVPLLGTLFGLVALVAFPAPLPWEAVVGVVGVFLVTEFLNCLWPAALLNGPNGPEDRK